MTGQGAWAAAAVHRPQQGRVRRGRRAYRAGLEAEEQVSGHYAARGATILARRWRVAEGEIDLVVAWPGTVAFVEVKSGQHSAGSISERQWQRLEAAALRFTVEQETGDAILRFDAAFVGVDGALDIVENARGF